MEDCRQGSSEQGRQVKEKRGSLLQKRKIPSLIDRGWLAAKQIMRDVTSNMYESFVNLRHTNKTAESMYTNRKPSKMTIQLIKQIHCGFEPLEISAQRWFSQEEEQNKSQKKHVHQILSNQELLNSYTCEVKPQRKKMVRNLDDRFVDPKSFEIDLWKIAEDNIIVSTKRLEAMQRQQKEREQKKIANEINCNQARPQANKIQQNKQFETAAVVADQIKTLEQPQNKSPAIPQSKSIQQLPSNQQIDSTSAQSELPIIQSAENKQEEVNKDKVLSTSNKMVNPFLTPVSKPLSLLDLPGLKSDIFGSHIAQPIANDNLAKTNYQHSNQSPFAPKNDVFLWSNTNNQNQTARIDLKSELFNNTQRSGVINSYHSSGSQFPPFSTQQDNPFSNSNSLNISKKGLSPGQMTTSTIFKSNQSLQKINQQQSPSKVGRQFSQAFNSGNISNQKVKAMFSRKQTTPSQPQSLFEPPAHPRQNTVKKNREDRRGKKGKQDRVF